MLEYEIAAMYGFIDGTINATAYFKEIPENFVVPCVFYPTPEQSGAAFSTSKHATDFTMYVKFMAKDTMEAYSLASAVMKNLVENRLKVLLVDENGKPTGKRFQIKEPVIRKVDSGVYQMQVSWRRYSLYNKDAVTMAQSFFMNGKTVPNK